MATFKVSRATGGNRWGWQLIADGDGSTTLAVAARTFPTEDKARRDAEATKRAMGSATVQTVPR